MIKSFIMSSLVIINGQATAATYSNYYNITHNILSKMGIGEISVNIHFDEVQKQEALFTGINYQEALSTAIEAFIHEGQKEPETPLNLVTEDYHKKQCTQSLASERVICWMNKKTTTLEIVYRNYNHLPLITSSRPEWGESISSNWIFHLKVPSLSDHMHWAVVDRNGIKPAYVYSLN